MTIVIVVMIAMIITNQKQGGQTCAAGLRSFGSAPIRTPLGPAKHLLEERVQIQQRAATIADIR